jgi:hypothetical protein
MFGNEFIYQSYLKDLSVCDRLIEYHKSSLNKRNGFVGGKNYVKEMKTSTDVTFLPGSEEYVDYYKNLQIIVNEYNEKFEYSSNFTSWAPVEYANIQHYSPGEGYKIWHFERLLPSFPNSTRHLVYMTYLNDVHIFGETEWYYQQIKIKPKKGLTVIWPADWTFTHRGIIAPNEDKYIITGWFNYIQFDDAGKIILKPTMDPGLE